MPTQSLLVLGFVIVGCFFGDILTWGLVALAIYLVCREGEL